MPPKQELKVQEKKVIFFGNYFSDKTTFFFYETPEERFQTFKYYMDEAFINDMPVLHFFPMNLDRLDFMGYFKNYKVVYEEKQLSIKGMKFIREEDIPHIMESVEEFIRPGKSCRILIDFGFIRGSQVDVALVLIEKLNEIKDKPISVLVGMNIKFLKQEEVDGFLKMGGNFLLDQKKFGNSIVYSDLLDNLKIDVISGTNIEQYVKKSLNLIVLSFLYQNPMSGFDVIKSILKNFNVQLSQGTVYPILYSLEEKGFVETRLRKDNKTKIYDHTEEGLRYIKVKMKEYLKAQEMITSLVKEAD